MINIKQNLSIILKITLIVSIVFLGAGYLILSKNTVATSIEDIRLVCKTATSTYYQLAANVSSRIMSTSSDLMVAEITVASSSPTINSDPIYLRFKNDAPATLSGGPSIMASSTGQSEMQRYTINESNLYTGSLTAISKTAAQIEVWACDWN